MRITQAESNEREWERSTFILSYLQEKTSTDQHRIITHDIFLATIMYRYNTDDPRCYHDLARLRCGYFRPIVLHTHNVHDFFPLRGIEYITWENGDKIWKEAEVGEY